MDSLATNVALRHLDLSDNSIAQLGDIHLLNNLKVQDHTTFCLNLFACLLESKARAIALPLASA